MIFAVRFSYTLGTYLFCIFFCCLFPNLMHAMGFEPMRLSPAELKSAPLDHSGTRALPLSRPEYLFYLFYFIYLIPPRGIEPRSTGWKPGIITIRPRRKLFKLPPGFEPGPTGSKPVVITTRLRELIYMCSRPGSNRRPQAHKTCALTNWATRASPFSWICWEHFFAYFIAVCSPFIGLARINFPYCYIFSHSIFLSYL